jgi:hypothetical protein
LKRIRKFCASLLIGVLIGLVFVPGVLAAGSVSVGLSPSKGTVRAGDTFTISVTLSGVAAAGGVITADMAVRYDTTRFSFVSGAVGGGKPASDFSSSDAGGKVSLIYSNGSSDNYFKSNATLAVLTFKVKANAPTGTANFSSEIGQNGAGTFANGKLESIGSSFSGTSVNVAAAVSGDNNLQTLNLANATLSPKFSAGTTKYTVKVENSVSKLQILALAVDKDAKVAINSPTLKEGGVTNATVVVTAANGSQKTYTLTVTREAKADEPTTESDKSKENALAELSVENSTLTPLFNAETLAYVAQLPLGTQKAVVTAKPKDDKAEVKISGTEELNPGVNLVVITVTAEDGTVKEYKITLNVGEVSVTGVPPATSQTFTMPPTVVDLPSELPETPSGGISWWWLILVFIVGIGAGVLLEHYVLPTLDKNRHF